MELFLPSILLLIIAAVIVMFVIPRLSPVILGSLALVFLLIAGYQHYKIFGTEYHQSTWQIPLLEGAWSYAPYILVGILILFLLFFVVNFIGTSSTEAAAPIQAMNQAIEKVMNTAPPSVAQAANTVKNTINRGAEALGLGAGQTNNRAINRPPNSNRPVNRPPNSNRPTVGGIPLSQI
jgi:hypothetical protein